MLYTCDIRRSQSVPTILGGLLEDANLTMAVPYSNIILPWTPDEYPTGYNPIFEVNIGELDHGNHWFDYIVKYNGRDTSMIDFCRPVEGRTVKSYTNREKKAILDDLRKIYEKRIRPYEDVVLSRDSYVHFQISLHSLPIYWAERISPGLAVPPTQEIGSLQRILHAMENYNSVKLWARRFSAYFHVHIERFNAISVPNQHTFIFDRRLSTFVDLQKTFHNLRLSLRPGRGIDIETKHTNLVKNIEKLFEAIEYEFLAALFYSILSINIRTTRNMREDLKVEAERLALYETLQNFYENEVIDAYNATVTELVIARARRDKHNLLKAMSTIQSKKDTTLYEDFNKLAVETDRKKRRTSGVNFTWPKRYKVHETMPESYDDLIKSYIAAEKSKDEAVKGRQMNRLAHMISKFASKKEREKGEPYNWEHSSIYNISREFTPLPSPSFHDSGMSSGRRGILSPSSSRPSTSTPKRGNHNSSQRSRVTFAQAHPDSSELLSDLSIIQSSDSEASEAENQSITDRIRRLEMDDSSRYETAVEERDQSVQSESNEDSDSLSDSFASLQSDGSEDGSFQSAVSNQNDTEQETSETESDNESITSLSRRINTSTNVEPQGGTFVSMIRDRLANIFYGRGSRNGRFVVRSNNFFGAAKGKNPKKRSISLDDIRRLNSELTKKLDSVSDEERDKSLGKRFLHASQENLTEDFHIGKIFGSNHRDSNPLHSTPIHEKASSDARSQTPGGLPFSIFRDTPSPMSRGTVPAELRDGRSLDPKLLNVYKAFRGGDVGYEEDIIKYCDSIKEAKTLPETTFNQGPRLYKDMMSSYCLDNLDLNKENIPPVEISSPKLEKTVLNTDKNLIDSTNPNISGDLINFTQPTVVVNKKVSNELTGSEKASIVNSYEMLRRHKKRRMKLLNEKMQELDKLRKHGIKRGVKNLYNEILLLGEELDSIKVEMDKLSEIGKRIWNPSTKLEESVIPTNQGFQAPNFAPQPDLAQILNGVAESFGKSLEPLLGTDKIRPKPFSGRPVDFPRWLSLLVMAFKDNGYYRGEHAEIYKLMDLKNCIKHLGGYPNGNPVVNDILSLPLRKSNCAYALNKLIQQYYDKSSMSKELKQEFRKNIIERRGRIDDKDYFCLKDILLKIDTHVSQLIKIGKGADIAIPEADWHKIYVSMPDRMKENFIALKDEFIKNNRPTREQMEGAYLLLYKQCLELALTRVMRMNKELGVDINSISRKRNVTSYVAGSKVFPKTKAKKRKNMNKIKKRIRDKNHPERVSSYYTKPRSKLFRKPSSNTLKSFSTKRRKPTLSRFSTSRFKPYQRNRGYRPGFSNFRNSTQVPLYKEKNKALKSMVNSSFAAEARPRTQYPKSKSEKGPSFCYYCNKVGHLTSFCNSNNKTSKEKFQIVKKNNLCFNCLSKHPKNHCYTKLSCRKSGCTRLHHSSLHNYFVPNSNPNSNGSAIFKTKPSRPLNKGFTSWNKKPITVSQYVNKQNSVGNNTMRIGTNATEAKKISPQTRFRGEKQQSRISKETPKPKRKILDIFRKSSSRQIVDNHVSTPIKNQKSKAISQIGKNIGSKDNKNHRNEWNDFAPVYERPGKINWQTIREH